MKRKKIKMNPLLLLLNTKYLQNKEIVFKGKNDAEATCHTHTKVLGIILGNNAKANNLTNNKR